MAGTFEKMVVVRLRKVEGGKPKGDIDIRIIEDDGNEQEITPRDTQEAMMLLLATMQLVMCAVEIDHVHEKADKAKRGYE